MGEEYMPHAHTNKHGIIDLVAILPFNIQNGDT